MMAESQKSFRFNSQSVLFELWTKLHKSVWGEHTKSICQSLSTPLYAFHPGEKYWEYFPFRILLFLLLVTAEGGNCSIRLRQKPKES